MPLLLVMAWKFWHDMFSQLLEANGGRHRGLETVRDSDNLVRQKLPSNCSAEPVNVRGFFGPNCVGHAIRFMPKPFDWRVFAAELANIRLETTGTNSPAPSAESCILPRPSRRMAEPCVHRAEEMCPRIFFWLGHRDHKGAAGV
ncbi:unnamed protein product [Fusarium fujikuroi]|uniref:Uncharacterized protein n=1 Tax=Fusarium fujikuroi TaxID=5127 RepID=A0A9Q9RU59_FUSFU|nr:unnamed protein product [Fusarium fujikuroi]VTT76834.1 unnamed protein product [Fusarium fujikuroi]VZH89495.1 unnamed protein product [Fusarium fujikuroi]